ncbi:hypothetical protein PR003_g15648 [Phytophthora rubi]|uniref:Uncharacterized protein n=1 Tax=Phytophthora rubi TaxID=129364 RepID=A0A6A3LJ20_9STRA|nr:hypothetical protein PR001_g13893 [Phytophthora rubi]KAE9329020.1 hypothetical protein PR003_g15648 [Phytophthora rubi]
MWRESSVDEFLSCFPADMRATCNVVCPKASKRFVRGLIVTLKFEIRATKWAADFLQIVHTARKQKCVSLHTAIAVKWAICAHVQNRPSPSRVWSRGSTRDSSTSPC